MSWLSKQIKSAGKIVKNPVKWAENAGRTVGKAAKQAAPAVGLIPGVGAPLGAAIGGLGSVLSGGNMTSHAKSALTGGLSGYANTKMLGGQGYKGILSKVPGMGAGTSAMPTTASAGNTAVSAIPSTSGGLTGQYGNVGSLFPAGGSGIGVEASSLGGSLGGSVAGALPEAGALGLGSSAASAVAPGLMGRALGFAEKYPNAVAGALSAASNLGGNDRENRLMDEQTERLSLDNAETSYDFEQRRQREEQLKQIFADLGITTDGFRDVAPNPYAQVG